MGLSGQLVRVLELLIQDYSDKEIASDLGISASTVKYYLARIGRQTGTRGRVQLLAYVLKVSHDLPAGPAKPSKSGKDQVA